MTYKVFGDGPLVFLVSLDGIWATIIYKGEIHLPLKRSGEKYATYGRRTSLPNVNSWIPGEFFWSGLEKANQLMKGMASKPASEAWNHPEMRSVDEVGRNKSFYFFIHPLGQHCWVWYVVGEVQVAIVRLVPGQDGLPVIDREKSRYLEDIPLEDLDHIRVKADMLMHEQLVFARG
ncbi:hypothetical protein KKH05_02330 [Patescibacteria group bacterium]|nr:hypothetical protein [Patescibacteria group bacterium]